MLPRRSREKAALTEAERQTVNPADLPKLLLSRNDSLIQKFSLDVPRLLIGRSEENDIAIPSNYVSRNHILLLRHRGSTILIDLNSTNGTFVNSKRVYTHVLANDDVITVDLHSMFVQYSIRFSAPSSATNKDMGDIESADEAIAKAVADVAALLGRDDTDLLPALRENVPTEVGYIDDR